MNTPALPQLPFRISICGRADLPQFANTEVTHLLSIDNPETVTPTPAWLRGVHWHCLFHDVDTTYLADGNTVIAPTRENVHNILDYGRTCLDASREEPVHLLIHCAAGVSRSPAAAYSILCMILGSGRENDALQHLLAIKSDVCPNPLVVQHADDLLCRHGRMLTALHTLRGDFD